MRNLNKKQNLVEQARIKLDEEKIAHSITQVRVKELESIINKAIEYANKRQEWLMNCKYDKIGVHNYINFALEIIDILKGSDKK